MSLARLKERLNQIVTTRQNDDTSTVELSEQNTNTWLQKISRRGNQPEDWLEYINLVKNEVTFPNNMARHNFLDDLYEKALQDIKSDVNRNNEAYARLFVDYAWLKSEYLTEDVQMVFNQARAIVRKFAFVHIASAKFELETLGNKSKALKILEKAVLFEAKPTEDLKEAIKNIKEGKEIVLKLQEIYTKDRERLRVPSGELSQEVKSSISPLQPTISPPQSTSRPSTKSLLESAVKPSLDHSMSQKPPNSLLQLTTTPSIGVPAETIKNSEPFKPVPHPNHESFNVPSENIKNSDPFKPVPHPNHESFNVPSEHIKSSDPGKPVTHPNHESFSIEPRSVNQPVSDPRNSSHAKLGMRSYHSTPLLNSEKKRTKEFAPPMRVKRINLPFNELVENEEAEFEDTMDSFKPLDTHHGNGVLGLSHAHTSGYQSMTQLTDCTVSTEIKPLESKKQDLTEEKLNIDPVVERSRFKPMIQLPEPKVMKSIPEIPREPQHVENKPYQQVSQPAYSAPPVHNPVLCTPSMKGMVPGNVIPNTPLANIKMITVNGEQYGILGVMGKGGSSKVYKVFDSQYVVKAVKVVNLDNANDVIVEGYKNEIKLLKRLQYCDKVIKMYDYEYNEGENKLYVVMEAGSEDLASFFRSRTKDRKPLSDNLIRFYWEIMLEAVQALHREGIIHSDLKPANFLLVGGNLKLIDFGIAKALQQDKTGVILETQIGTLNYMSPEAIKDWEGCGDEEGKPKFKIGVKSDVWSLGCILYNMVYGRTPFQHLRHDFSKLQAIINPDFPIEFPDIPDKHLIDVMKRCLNRNPKSRPSIDELLSHPYLIGDSSEEIMVTKEDKIINKKMEALVSTLASQYALSPGGVRNLIKRTMDTEQNSPDAILRSKSSGPENNQPSSSRSEVQRVPNPMKPSLVNRPQGPVTIKHMRAPLQSLSLQGIHSSAKVQGPEGQSHRNPAGS